MALYVILYTGYTLYERFWLHKGQHFVPLREVDFDTDAVWLPGQGETVREKDRVEDEERREEIKAKGVRGRGRVWWSWVTEYVY